MSFDLDQDAGVLGWLTLNAFVNALTYSPVPFGLFLRQVMASPLLFVDVDLYITVTSWHW